MIRVGRVVVISLVATNAGDGGVVVVSSLVAAVAVYCAVSSCQGIICNMDRKSSWRPARIGGMTGLTRGRYAQRPVVGVDRLVVISLVTAYAGVGRVVEIPAHMATVAVYRGMSACQRVISIMDRKSRRFPARVSGMAIFTCEGNSSFSMLWIGRVVIIRLMTARTSGGGVIIVPSNMATVAVGRGMCAR